MARTKQGDGRREPSFGSPGNGNQNGTSSSSPRNLKKKSQNGGTLAEHTNVEMLQTLVPESRKEAGAIQFLIAVGGIYGSFLTWAYLQERLTTTPYGSAKSPELFKFPVFLNTVQSLCAALSGYLYLLWDTPKGQSPAAIFPSRSIVLPLIGVAITSSLASPFGYASLAHIDYITFILAKSCKLLPVMFLHITLFQRRFPFYKYAVVFAVTSGVAIFTLHAGSAKSHSKPSKAHSNPDRNVTWGLLLLGINLLFDGLTNTTQDHIFQKNKNYKGPQMMCANNLIMTVLTLAYLLASPYLVQTGLGKYLGMDLVSGGKGELADALAFMARHPGVWYDVLGFSFCGAVGQVFIFYTLSTFSSLLLVTITVTRKMLTMILSVVAFGHSLGLKQWAGVGLVFGGIGAEGIITRMEKAAKEKSKKEAVRPKKEL